MSKRRRFLITSILLSLGFMGIQLLTDQNRFWAIGILGFLAMALFGWSLWEGLGKDMTLLTLVLPTIFTFGVGIFWFLLPGSVFARIPIIIFYGIGIYILALTMNIYTVSAIRTIALLRAAMGVGFVLTLVTSFLVFDAILSLKTSTVLSPLLIGLISFPLFLQGFWAMDLKKELSLYPVRLSIVSSLVIGEIASVLYFWPVTVVVGALFLTVSVYMLLGLGQAKIEGRLFSSTVREHLTVGISVFVAIFFATHWSG